MAMLHSHDTIVRPFVAPTERLCIMTTKMGETLVSITASIHYSHSPLCYFNRHFESTEIQRISQVHQYPTFRARLGELFTARHLPRLPWQMCDLPHRVSQHHCCPALPTMLSRKVYYNCGDAVVKGHRDVCSKVSKSLAESWPPQWL